MKPKRSAENDWKMPLIDMEMIHSMFDFARLALIPVLRAYRYRSSHYAQSVAAHDIDNCNAYPPWVVELETWRGNRLVGLSSHESGQSSVAFHHCMCSVCDVT
jgi:hypothetical protein